MIQLMHEYGSEVSDTAMPPRKTCVLKASVVRQFRRWNPNFLQYFEFSNGKWIPKLGRDAELVRREKSRQEASLVKKKSTGCKGGRNSSSPLLSPSSSSQHNNNENSGEDDDEDSEK